MTDTNTFDLKALREHLGWSQLQMAEALACDRTSISLYERGARIPSLRLREINRIADDAKFSAPVAGDA